MSCNSFGYDHRGNLTGKTQTIGTTSGALLGYQYDTADRVNQITYPSGREVRYLYDGKGRVSAIDTRASSSGSWASVSSAYAYEPFGAVASMALGNGLAVTNVRGPDGRLAARRLYNASTGASLSHLAYRTDADGNIAAIDEIAGCRVFRVVKRCRLT